MRVRKCQKRAIRPGKEPYILGKETYECTGIPEVCGSVKRDLFIWQKRPMNMSIREGGGGVWGGERGGGEECFCASGYKGR